MLILVDKFVNLTFLGRFLTALTLLRLTLNVFIKIWRQQFKCVYQLKQYLIPALVDRVLRIELDLLNEEKDQRYRRYDLTRRRSDWDRFRTARDWAQEAIEEAKLLFYHE